MALERAKCILTFLRFGTAADPAEPCFLSGGFEDPRRSPAMTMIWNSVLCLTTRLSQQVYDDRFELVAIVVPSPQVSSASLHSRGNPRRLRHG